MRAILLAPASTLAVISSLKTISKQVVDTVSTGEKCKRSDMFHAHNQEPKKPKKLPWYGRWSNRLVVLLSAFFLLLGLGLLAVGIVMMVLMRQKLLTRDEVKVIFNGIQYNGSLKIGDVLNNLPLLSICVGGVVFFLAIFTCCGRGLKNRICLTLNAILIFWFLIVQILTCAMWVVMRDKFEDSVKSYLDTSFQQYEGVTSTNDASVGWDLLHVGFDCCSLNVITSSSNQHTFNVTTWWGNRPSALDLLPASCCMGATESNYRTYTDLDCERVLLSHKQKACFDEILSWLKLFWEPAIIIAASLIAVEVLLIFLSCVLCCGIRQSREIRY